MDHVFYRVKCECLGAYDVISGLSAVLIGAILLFSRVQAIV